MKKKMWMLTLAMLALVIACGKKDFSKMTFQDGSYAGQYVSEDSEHKDSCEVILEIKENKIVSCQSTFKDAQGEIKDEHYGENAGEEKFTKAQLAVQGFEKYSDMLLEVQDPEKVDSIAGATVSNKEFKAAVWNALEKAK